MAIQLESNQIQDAAIIEAKIGSGAVAFAKLKSSDIETTLVGSSTKIPRADAVKNYVDASSAGLEILDDSIDVVNAASAPPTENTGDVYIIGDSSSAHADWDGVITGNGDQVKYNGSSWELHSDVSVVGSARNLLSWSTTDGLWLKLTSGTTTWTEHGGLAGVTAGQALTKTGNTLDVAVDDSSIEIASDALQLKNAGVTSLKIATGAVTADKVNKSAGLADAGAGALGLASGVAGDGLAISSQVLSVNVDDSGIEIAADALQLKDAGVTNAKLAGSITADKMQFASNWDVLTADGSTTAFDLSGTVDAQFASIIVIRGGAVQKQVASSPADDSEFSVSLTGGAGGVTRITFGSAPANGVDLRVWFIA